MSRYLKVIDEANKCDRHIHKENIKLITIYDEALEGGVIGEVITNDGVIYNLNEIDANINSELIRN